MSMTTSRQRLYLALSLATLMAATRSHHFATPQHLPDASWAVLFLAGAYLRPVWIFPSLCVLAAAVDWIAIAWGGVSAFCVTPAYAMLLPAYAALWLGGRWYARRRGATPLAVLAPLTFAVLASAFAAELFSSGGFYFLGGRYAEPSLAGFLPRLAKYFPPMLGAMALYAGAAECIRWLAGAAAAARLTGRPQ